MLRSLAEEVFMKSLLYFSLFGLLFLILFPLSAKSLSSAPFPIGSSQRIESDYVVQVDLCTQRLYIFHKGEQIRQMVCSSGLPLDDNNTPTGRFMLNETGKKKGLWFYSRTFQEGAQYWVGFIGGIYLFHTVPMDINQKVIPKEEAKLGQPASHGCVRLSKNDAKWFYETIPNGSVVYIQGITPGTPGKYQVTPPLTQKKTIAPWLAIHHMAYYQKYLLSCEAAMERMILAFCGVDVEEDSILDQFPKGKNPESAFVCDNINQGRRTADGTILWDNYGAHPPVVVNSINHWLNWGGRINNYRVTEEQLSDEDLKQLCREDSCFLGAIIWVVGHPERWGENPQKNERGMVLGEHVRFISPQLDKQGNFLVWDPEYHSDLPHHNSTLPTRNNFHNRVVVIRRTPE